MDRLVGDGARRRSRAHDGLLRDHIGRVLPLNPPESLTIAAAKDALRIADASQTLFLVTDGAGLNDLMATNGWRDMARVGLELVNPRIWGRTLYVFARGGTLDPRSPLKGWVRWAGPASPDVRNRAAAVVRRLGYVNVTFETMNVARRMADGLDLGGAAGGVDIVCIYDEEPSSSVDSFVRGDRREDWCPPAPARAGRESIERGRWRSRSDHALQLRSTFMSGRRDRLIIGHHADLVGGRDSATRRPARQ